MGSTFEEFAVGSEEEVEEEEETDWKVVVVVGELLGLPEVAENVAEIVDDPLARPGDAGLRYSSPTALPTSITTTIIIPRNIVRVPAMGYYAEGICLPDDLTREEQLC